MDDMRLIPQHVPRQRAGREFALKASLGIVIGLALIAPPQAAGHAGEVHSEPAPAVEKPVVPGAAVGTGSNGGGESRSASTANPAGGDRAAVAVEDETTTSAPPAPEVPESNPTVHFLILGALALLGGGAILLLRRRNALG
jgi:LPXTG-motif cell wall-anchored protein